MNRHGLKYPQLTQHDKPPCRPLLGGRNWLSACTEIGAQRVGVIQSLLVTRRLQGVDPHTYLVDVLQRISDHPASQVADLAPRLWKTTFAHHPLRSDLALATH
jgi:hypothetical protein